MNIFLDLDGPILDNSYRLYSLYASLMRKFGKQPMPMRTYWSLKKDCLPEERIIAKNLSGKPNTIRYLKKREELIELRQYLKMNKIVDGCYTALQFLAKQGRLFLITTRRRKKNLMWELKQKKLTPFFYCILCGFDQSIPAWEIKTMLIKKNGLLKEPGGIIIGDTEAEVICGRNTGLYTVAVTNGIRTRKHLETLKPDMICKDIGDVVRRWHFIVENKKKLDKI